MNTNESNDLPADIKALFARYFPELNQCVADIRAMPSAYDIAARSDAITDCPEQVEDDSEWHPFTLQALADSPVVLQMKQSWHDALQQCGVDSFDGVLATIARGYQEARLESIAQARAQGGGARVD